MPNLSQIYQLLFDYYGPQHWWPATTPFEMAVGAILTQNTNWGNVEKAMTNLVEANMLDCDRIFMLALTELEQLIRPSGFFRQKAERLKLFCAHLRAHHRGTIEALVAQPLAVARKELLSLKGIGPETADAILLYAGNQASFVVDSYTGRLFQRLGILTGRENYTQIRALFMQELAADAAYYNEYHALIVAHSKAFCRKIPLCTGCPCAVICRYPQDQSLN
jgi:endonuclease-3 related protein